MTATTPHAGRDLTVSERWAQALAGWELELQAADRPATTRYLRGYHLRRLADDFPDRDPWTLTRTELVDWLAGWSWSRETRRSYRSSLRSFYGWGMAAGLVVVSPAVTLPPITPERGLPRPVPSERLEAAIAAADPRVHLALLLLAETGIRRAELAATHTDDLLQDCNGWSLRVVGKGRRERRVPIGCALGELLTLVPRGGCSRATTGASSVASRRSTCPRPTSASWWLPHSVTAGRPTPCGTASERLPTPSSATCGQCKSCSDARRSRRRRSTRRCPTVRCVGPLRRPRWWELPGEDPRPRLR